MQWSIIRSWAKEHGYTSFREKTDREDNPNDYDYYWGKEDDPTVTGISNSVSKLATDIYNHMTNYEFVDYQNEYKENLKNKEIKYEGHRTGRRTNKKSRCHSRYHIDKISRSNNWLYYYLVFQACMGKNN